jgi:RNA polymerase sigma-70 factor (ECF subfamily)
MITSREDRIRAFRQRADAELVAAADDDAEAFGVFYERHQVAVFSFFVHRTRSPVVSEELTSETFATAFLISSRYEPARGAATAWLFGIAKNVLLLSYRRCEAETASRRELGLGVVALSDGVWEEVQRRLDESLLELELQLLDLTDREQEAVHARVVLGRQYAEIAADGDTTEAAVRQRVSRALRKLASQFERDR